MSVHSKEWSGSNHSRKESLLKLKPIERLVYWIKERHSIYMKKSLLKQPKPWTDDYILQNYRFCNVYRQLDTVTEWIKTNWLDPNLGHKNLWFAMSVARWINWPDTLEAIGIENVLDWNPKQVQKTLNMLRKNGVKVWTGAYMIGTQGMTADKNDFVVNQILQRLWDQRKDLQPRKGDTLREFFERVIAVHYQGPFMVGQMIADIKYDPKCVFNQPKKVSDWYSFACSGPGSRRGLNRVLERRVEQSWKEDKWFEAFCKVRAQVAKYPEIVDMPKIHAQDFQNCLCEADKYERMLHGQGQARNRYNGRA